MECEIFCILVTVRRWLTSIARNSRRQAWGRLEFSTKTFGSNKSLFACKRGLGGWELVFYLIILTVISDWVDIWSQFPNWRAKGVLHWAPIDWPYRHDWMFKLRWSMLYSSFGRGGMQTVATCQDAVSFLWSCAKWNLRTNAEAPFFMWLVCSDISNRLYFGSRLLHWYLRSGRMKPKIDEVT